MKAAESEKIKCVFLKQKSFYESGALRSIALRKEMLQKLKDAILGHKDELYIALNEDLGKSKDAVDLTEIGRVIAEIDFSLQNLDAWSAPEKVPDYPGTPFSEAFIEHEAFGVSYIIGPFNYPINLLFCPLIGAISGGNTAILKPSENVPNTALVIEKIITSIFDEQYIAVINGGVDVSEFLLELPFDFIFFTGSPNVGKIVLSAAAKNITPVLLELGGKSPFIVLDDANIDKAVESIRFSRFYNSGQTCIAADYLLIHEDVKDIFVEKLVKSIEEKLPEVGSTGKLVSVGRVETLNGLLEKTKGKVLVGGKSNSSTREMQATVVDGIDWNDALMSGEIFGPILPVLTFKDITLAVKEINTHHPKPLAAYVFTNNIEEGKNILSHIPAGSAIVNGAMQQSSTPYIPFGGVGTSGLGDYHGHYSYLAFTHRKPIIINK